MQRALTNANISRLMKSIAADKHGAIVHLRFHASCFSIVSFLGRTSEWELWTPFVHTFDEWNGSFNFGFCRISKNCSNKS